MSELDILFNSFTVNLNPLNIHLISFRFFNHVIGFFNQICQLMLLFFWAWYLFILFDLVWCFSLLKDEDFVMKLNLLNFLVFELNLPCELSFIFVLIAHLLNSLTHFLVFFSWDFLFLFNIDKCHVHYHCFLLFWLFRISVLTNLLIDEHRELLWYFL